MRKDQKYETASHIGKIVKTLSRWYPEQGALHVGTPYHMLVMVALSARTRDEQILKRAPAFFRKFQTVERLASSDVASIEKMIRTIGMFRQKARNLSGMAKMIVEDFGGEVPKTMDELLRLPGVGRKTASVLLASIFATPAIAVDTHVHRVVNRLGFVKTTSPNATERELLRLVPRRVQRIVNQVFVPFGRSICIKKPRCWACPLVSDCPFARKNLLPPLNKASILKKITLSHENIRRLKSELVETFPSPLKTKT